MSDYPDWLQKEIKKQWFLSRKEIRRRRRQMFDICVGKETWDMIKADPNHPFHDIQKRQIRRYRLMQPWNDLRRWFLRVTGIERRYYRKLRKKYENMPLIKVS